MSRAYRGGVALPNHEVMRSNRQFTDVLPSRSSRGATAPLGADTSHYRAAHGDSRETARRHGPRSYVTAMRTDWPAASRAPARRPAATHSIRAGYGVLDRWTRACG